MRKSECCNENGRCRCNVWKCIGWAVLGVIGFAAIVALLGLAIMALWNAIIPGIFNLPAIGYWQAIGLAVLSRMLFGGLGFHHFRHKHHGGKNGCGCNCGCNCRTEKECCTDKTDEGECCKKDETTQA
ncbi:MAG: hypothetical protein WCX31_00455 [Salinivirgaceae bacterium]